MPRAYSPDLRERLLRARTAGLSAAEIERNTGVTDRAMKWLTPLGRIGGRIAFWLLQIPLVTPTHRVATAYSKGKRCSWRSRATRRCRGR